MKARIFSSFAVLAAVALFSCQGTSSDNNNKDSTAAINNAPDTTAAQGDQNTNNNATTTVDENTRTFMTKAAGAGNAEVELGQLAQQNAKNERVKNFGQMMVTDHSKANDDLKSIARQKNVTLPEGMDAEHQHHKEDLSKKKGADFDKAYINMMIDGHKKVIDEFEKCSKDATDPEVKNFATQTLPTIKMHLDSAQAIKKALK